MSEYVADYANSYALVMAVDAYQYLPPLTAVQGARDLAALLHDRYKFNVTLLTDGQLTRETIFGWFSRTGGSLGPDDRVLIYFAGHGMTRGQRPNERGYLCLPGTAPGEWHTALPMDDISEEASYFTNKHLLYVLDCCFSGMALEGRAVPDIPRELSFYLTRPVRYAITAGGKEVVDDALAPDGRHSLFTYYLLQWLTDERIRPEGGVWRARELGNYLEDQVASNRRGGHKPNHSYLPGSGDGDFVFRWESGTHLPREVEIPLLANNPMVRLGAVTALIELAKGSDPDMAALARSTLQKVESEDGDPSIKQVAGAFLEGREIAWGDATVSTELLQKLEEAKRQQAEQEQALEQAHQEREAALASAVESRQQLQQAEQRGNRFIYGGPLLTATAVALISVVPVLCSVIAGVYIFPGILIQASSSSGPIPGFCIAPVTLAILALAAIFHTNRVFKVEPGLGPPSAMLGAAIVALLAACVTCTLGSVISAPAAAALSTDRGGVGSEAVGAWIGYFILCGIPGAVVAAGAAYLRLSALKQKTSAAPPEAHTP
jgi:hypothetical protein